MRDNYTELAEAIILQALIDYKHAIKNINRKYKLYKSLRMKMSIERFVRTEWFATLCDIDGDFLLKKIREGVE